MLKQAIKIFMIIIMIAMLGNGFASNFFQEQQDSTTKIPEDWFLRDPETDHILGVSSERAYNTILKGKPSRTVLVAVIDSGIDTEHEDLKDVIWTNPKEIPGNGIDDDKNGYVDDVHGWNFIGGKTGNVSDDTFELTREFVRLKGKFENADENKISKKDKADYELWKKVKKAFEESSSNAKKQYAFYQGLYNNIAFDNDTLKQILGVKKLNLELLEKINSDDKKLNEAKGSLTMIFRQVGSNVDIEDVLKELQNAVDHFKNQISYGYNPEFDPRKIVGDDYNNLQEKNYGNNDVKGPDATHGTHVAGIIGANRRNNVGIRGIADNVKIMSVRAVPNGDERDKDIANAIRYAVDNGAQIVNMSFGKAYSPNKEAVDKAVKYAESKNVLLIHAAGNESKNDDEDRNFPNRYFLNGKEAKNWLEIGASAWGENAEFVAPFSNYGNKSVDLFAPGVEIYSTTPDNTYKNESGTSMASPSTAGVAALLMSYFPELSSVQVKDILRQSTRKFDNLKVNKPGGSEGEQIDFNKLSNTGGLVNAYDAVKLALLKRGKKPEN